MRHESSESQDAIWDLIEREKSRDRFLRRVGKTAWGTTFVALVIFSSTVVWDFSQMIRFYRMGAVRAETVVESIIPLVVAVGGLSLLIATLATIGVFLRLRTTSLTEIQLRLSGLEQMILDAQSKEGG